MCKRIFHFYTIYILQGLWPIDDSIPAKIGGIKKFKVSDDTSFIFIALQVVASA
jgi:hypothetical protein